MNKFCIFILALACFAGLRLPSQAAAVQAIPIATPVVTVPDAGSIAASVSGSVAASVAHHTRDRETDLPVSEQQTIRKSFSLTAAAGKNTLLVDNVWGSIEVVGTSGNQIQLVVNQDIRAETKDRLEAAKKEVTLDISQTDNSVRLFVNGPFRCNCNDCGGVNFHEDPGYRVRMDFELQVPNNIDLTLKTVNEGLISVQHVSGSYSLHNVNGKIDMLDIAGSGVVKTINGGVKITFRENPRENSSFASLNGNVELYFASNLSADFRFKTFNGRVYTDFPMTSLPQRTATEERRNGRFVFRADRYSGGRVGNGGVEITAENLNGDIRILEHHD